MSINKTFSDVSIRLGASGNAQKSFYTTDPITGNTVIHGATNNRPKAYAGDTTTCPWDHPKSILLQNGTAFLVPNDFPAISQGSIEDASIEVTVDDIYAVQNARGECLIVIYSPNHTGHWNSLSDADRTNVVSLWAASTTRAKSLGYRYSHTFENDGPLNSMTHPHGQQYNFATIPPFITAELLRAQTYFQKTGKNLFETIVAAELSAKERIIYENNSFIAFAPPGARWPFQVRIMPKVCLLWLFELGEDAQKDLVEIFTKIRGAYASYFSESYKPNFMHNIIQAPLNTNDSLYKQVFGLRIDIFSTALSNKAEKLMFSLENATGLIAYSYTPEEITQTLKKHL